MTFGLTFLTRDGDRWALVSSSATGQPADVQHLAAASERDALAEAVAEVGPLMWEHHRDGHWSDMRRDRGWWVPA